MPTKILYSSFIVIAGLDPAIHVRARNPTASTG